MSRPREDADLLKQLVSIVPKCGERSCGTCDARHEKMAQLITARDEQTAKAYGGCTKCYGKGYATYSGEYKARGMSWPDKAIRYCDCERGKQLEHRDEEREREILQPFTDRRITQVETMWTLAEARLSTLSHPANGEEQKAVDN